MIEKTFPITEKLLASTLKSTQLLCDLLNREYEQLQNSSDPTPISSIAANKKELVSQIEQLTKQLGQVLATEKLTINPDGIKSYFAKAQAADISITDSWHCWSNVAVLSLKCRELNERNGASIALLTRHTQRSLHILRGKSQLNTTYGPDGSTRSELFSHTLISV